MSYRSQAVASVVLGTPLAFALCGLYAELGPAKPATNYLVALCLLLPVWCAVMVWGLAQRNPRQSWLQLGITCAIVACAVFLAGVWRGA